MDQVRWILATALGLVSLWLIILNWRGFWQRHVRKRADASSWIPLLAGVLGSVALFMSPVRIMNLWWWIPLVIDWGSLPGIIYAIWWNAKRR